MSPKRFFGAGIPGFDLEMLAGKLIVVEGADGSGRSTQIAALVEWLEGSGHATVQVGLKRSTLVSEELERAQEGNILSRTTLSLFYATDFADQVENIILPALKAGFIVLADRYIYTLMARDIARGADREWTEALYSFAIVPCAVFYLQVSPRILVERTFQKEATLDYWESGMDIGLAESLFDSFMRYQKLIHAEFCRMQAQHGFQIVNGNRSIWATHRELQRKIGEVLGMGAEG